MDHASIIVQHLQQKSPDFNTIIALMNESKSRGSLYVSIRKHLHELSPTDYHHAHQVLVTAIHKSSH